MKNYDDKSEMAYYWLEENIGRVLLVVLFAGLGLWGLLLEGRDDLGLGQRLVRGMGPELAGIVIAAVTIDALAERRQEAERKRILIHQLGSKYRDVTEIAIIELREREWLYDGSLRGAFLWEADLSGADLFEADLRDGQLREANLSKVNLMEANLSGASLFEADMRGAFLSYSNLSQAFLKGAKLSWTDLRHARNWTIHQLDEAGELDAVMMPDMVRLDEEPTGTDLDWILYERFQGPTFDEWKAQYLATHGGTETDLRDPL